MRQHLPVAAFVTSLVCAATLFLSPPRATAQSFPCAKASTATEKMICADAAISKLDTQMAERYKALLAVDAKNASGATALQVRWLNETRNAARSAAALRQAYESRLEELDWAVRCVKEEISEWPEIKACAQIDFENMDAQLAALYRKLLAGPEVRADQEAAAALKRSQDAWLKYRDAQCEWQTAEMQGGTLRPLVISGCARALTVERIKQLTPEP